MLDLGEHYRAVDGRQRSDWARIQRQFIRNRAEQDHRDKQEDRLDDDLMALATEVTMATEARIRQFEVKFDTYDSATVEALMANQVLLDAVSERIQSMLDRAYVMGDGRRVFKTEDGTQVFDEFGKKVGADTIDPNTIGAEHPTWEEVEPEIAERARLIQERRHLLDYQDQLDAARDKIAEGDITVEQLDALDADLLDAMPDAVRAHAGIAPRTPAPDIKNAITSRFEMLSL